MPSSALFSLDPLSLEILLLWLPILEPQPLTLLILTHCLMQKEIHTGV